MAQFWRRVSQHLHLLMELLFGVPLVRQFVVPLVRQFVVLLVRQVSVLLVPQVSVPLVRQFVVPLVRLGLQVCDPGIRRLVCRPGLQSFDSDDIRIVLWDVHCRNAPVAWIDFLDKAVWCHSPEVCPALPAVHLDALHSDGEDGFGLEAAVPSVFDALVGLAELGVPPVRVLPAGLQEQKRPDEMPSLISAAAG